MSRRANGAASILAACCAAAPAHAGPDLALCQLYGLSQWSADGSARGLAMATTSWNIGTSDLAWFANPDPRHPFVAMNLYRLEQGRFEQIGVSWVKHASFALANLQCDMPNLPNCAFEPGHVAGDYLGQGCTDTYDAFLNAFDLGPRHEVNPWTGAFNYATSTFNLGGAPGDHERQLRVQDADLDPSLHPGAKFYMEAYTVHGQDMNALNNAAWKMTTPVRDGSGDYTFAGSPASTLPQWGFALDAWGADQSVVAEQTPVIEGVSPDGRCVLAWKVSDNGDGTWHYEYALLNVDLDRQVDSFSVPVPAGVNVWNIGFHAPAHTETRAWVGGPAISNDPWSVSATGGGVTWSTATNPLRWGTLYNFRFDADAPPEAAGATIGLFRAIPARPDALVAMTQGPADDSIPCPGDLDLSGTVDVDDLNPLLSAFGSVVGLGSPLDVANGDGFIDIDDMNVVLGNWGTFCGR